MIGVNFTKVKTFTDFAEFRKTWYIDSKVIFNKADIDSRLSAVVSDEPITDAKVDVIQYGKDIQNFAELNKYTRVCKYTELNQTDSSVLLKTQCDELEDLTDEDFEGLLPIETPSIQDVLDMAKDPGETDRRIAEQKERLEKIAAEQRAVAEAARLEKEREAEELAKKEAELQRLKQEAEERKRIEEAEAAERRKKEEAAERERILAEEKARLEEEEAKARWELAREKMRLEHEAQMAALQRDREQFKAAQLLNIEKAPLAPDSEIPMSTQSRTVHQMYGPLKQPSIPEFKESHTTTLRIGKKAHKKCNVYIVSSALADAGGSTFAYNLAYSTQGLPNQNVLLIDLDLTAPTFKDRFDIKSQDSSIDKIFQMDGTKYIDDIQYHTARVRLGGRELSVITANSLNYYGASDKKLLTEYDYSDLLRHVSKKYTTVIVDIGALTGILPYQTTLLKCSDFKQIICYASESSGKLNECIKTTYRLPANWSVVLCKAPKTINQITIEQTLRRPILGMIPSQPGGFDDVELIESTGGKELKTYWRELAMKSWRV